MPAAGQDDSLGRGEVESGDVGSKTINADGLIILAVHQKDAISDNSGPLWRSYLLTRRDQGQHG